MPTKEEPAVVKPEATSIKRDVPKATKKLDEVRARAGTWGAASGSKQKPTPKIPKLKEKDVRRNSDDRRQKRGEYCF